jgi:proline iminopeptidase
VQIEIEPGVRLFVDVDGPSLVPDGPALVERPTVVLLHGGPGFDHSIFKGSALSALTDVAQVVFYDHRSQGRSDARPSDEWTLDVWADDVVRLCDALGVTKPIVIGASFGGMVAQRYLARHPEHPSKVVLLCTSPRMDNDAVAASFARFGGPEAGEAARRLFSGDSSVLGDFLTHCMPLYATGELDPFVMMRSSLNTELQNHFFAGEAQTMDLAAGLANAACPVLVVGGELDPVCPIEMSELIAASLPPHLVTFERIAGASHADVSDRAGIEAVRRFLST